MSSNAFIANCDVRDEVPLEFTDTDAFYVYLSRTTAARTVTIRISRRIIYWG